MRPARPTCWRIDASVPGKPLSTTASSATDVDAELERAGGDHPTELTARELRLRARAVRWRGSRRGTRRPPVPRRVVGTCLRERAACVRGDELCALAAARERERLVAVGDEAREHHRGLGVRRRARARVHVDERSLPHREAALGLRRAVAVDRLDRESAEARRELGGVADGGAGEAERGRRSVVLAEPTQATQHVRDVAAEHAAQRVQLVDDDVAQAQQERGPPVVAWGGCPCAASRGW